jgi:methyl halide transferase
MVLALFFCARTAYLYQMEINAVYWEQRWQAGQTGWDVGYATPAIVAFCAGIQDRGLKILVPGAGNGYEAEYLWKEGFRNLDIVDLSQTALSSFQARVPDFPPAQLVHGDFFDLLGPYDLVIEQTFFCALHPRLRRAYVDHMLRILRPGGVLAGLLFDFPLTEEGPPFGGSKEEYFGLFTSGFEIRSLDRCTSSIAPRAGRELWLEVEKKG